MKISEKILLIILFAVASCKDLPKENANPKSEQDSLPKTRSDTLIEGKESMFQLDTAYFRNRADSLFTYINHRHKCTQLRVDTFKYNRYYWYYPFLDSTHYTIRYRFIPKPDTHLGFEVYEAHYKNHTISNDRFLKTYQEGVDSLGMPGLSYAYDFVIKKDDVIVALAVPCTFSGRNEQRLLKYFKAAFHTPIPLDTLTCPCGFFCQ